MKQIGLLLLSTLFVASCDAQNKPPVQDSAYAAATPRSTPRIPKTANSKNNNVHCALQDKEGNLWFGTMGDGIYKYDGRTFINYTEKDGISSNRVHALLEDKDGFVWIGTDPGLCRFTPEDGTFTTMAIPATGGGSFFITGQAVAPTQVWSIMQDKSGKLWFGTNDEGVLCYDGKTFTRFLRDNGVVNESKLKLNAVNCIKQDEVGNIWFATWFEGLCRYDGKSIVSYKPNDEVWFSSMLEDNDGTMWVGRRTKGFFRFDPTAVRNDGLLNHTNVTQNGTLDSCSVGFLLQDKAGAFWLGSIHSNMTRREEAGGLWRFDPSAKPGTQFKNFTAKDNLPNNNVWSAVEDMDGDIWFGTVGNGLYRYDGKTFTSFSE